MLFGIFWSFCRTCDLSVYLSLAHSQCSASHCALWGERVLLLVWEIPPQGLITTRQIVSAPQNRTDSEWMEQTGLFSPYIITKWWLCMWEVALNRKITTPTITLSAQLSGLSQSRSDLEQQSSLLQTVSGTGGNSARFPPFLLYFSNDHLHWAGLHCNDITRA